MVEMTEELRAALEADDAEEFGRILRRRRPEDVEALHELLSPDVDVPGDQRMKAMHALGAWREESAVPEIRRLLPDLDERGRIGALSALGRIGTPAAADALAEHAADPSEQVRKAVAVGLARADTPAARERLLDIARSDPAPWIRDLAARRLP